MGITLSSEEGQILSALILFAGYAVFVRHLGFSFESPGTSGRVWTEIDREIYNRQKEDLNEVIYKMRGNTRYVGT